MGEWVREWGKDGGMARRIRDEDDGPSEADLERFSDVTQTCPKCGTTLYDDVDVCWQCGAALMGEKVGLPRWVWVVGAVMLVGLVVGVLWRG